VQQLSLAAPQLVNPVPPGAQLVMAAHAPLAHDWLAAHPTTVPHWPQELHVCTPLPEHLVAPGVHTGLGGHEQPPQEHVALHVCVP
jgi:hypothetical protein